MTKKELKNFKIDLTIVTGILIFAFFFWDTFVVFPIKVFVVILHESSHGLAAIITGGKTESIVVDWTLGGVTTTSGGNSFIISSAGYLGSLLIGALLFYFADKQKPFLIVSRVIAVLLVLFVTNLFIGSAGIIFGLVFVVLLFVIPTYSSEIITKITFQSIGLTSCLYTLLDIKSDLLTTKYRLTDAQLLANDTSVPAVYWGILWILISWGLIYLMIMKKYSPLWKKSRR